ncbi:beta-ketoacyl-[acyl-carrier-protein] synthase family protein [Streptomyces sp. NPDC002668]|uniref:beta-ketoacyl-[acyl-carrier-protein] synthase family protein n=1 Tax=Streptomyces sp. NPDC002668 TaxID=3154422 RepID=UPI0033247DC6
MTCEVGVAPQVRVVEENDGRPLRGIAVLVEVGGHGSDSRHGEVERRGVAAEFTEERQDECAHAGVHVAPHAAGGCHRGDLMAAGEVAIDLGARGPNFTTCSACASGATAIGVARDLLRSGTCDIVLAGGSESARSRMTATCFTRMRALSRQREHPQLSSRPFDAERDGFVLGEGTAVLVLERLSHASARRAPVQAVLRGYGAGADAHHPVDPHPDGHGAERAIRAALEDAACDPGNVGLVNAHGTSTPLNDAAEAEALTRVFGKDMPTVTAAKGVIGHALGAAGAIQAAYTGLALHRRTVPPVANFEGQDGDHKLDIVASRPRPVAESAGPQLLVRLRRPERRPVVHNRLTRTGCGGKTTLEPNSPSRPWTRCWKRAVSPAPQPASTSPHRR